MKKTILSMAFIVLAITLTAGNNNEKLLRLGVGVGMTHAEFKAPNNWVGDNSIFGDAGTGYNMRVFLKFNVPVLPIYIQPEALYSFQKSINTDEIKNLTIKKLDFPIMVGLQLINVKAVGVRLNAGPVFNLSDSSADKTQPLRWAAGAGIDLMNTITLDVRYHGRFKGNSYNKIDTNFSYWSYGIGFMF